jgi:hypothetical protein
MDQFLFGNRYRVQIRSGFKGVVIGIGNSDKRLEVVAGDQPGPADVVQR